MVQTAKDPQEVHLGGSADRKKREGAPRWMVTFADLMSLLFAMFVLILSFSEVDSDSFKRNAGSMHEAFNQPEIQIPSQTVTMTLNNKESTDEPPPEVSEWKENTLYQLRAALATEIKYATTVVLEQGRNIVIRFPDQTAFASGSFELRSDILPVLDKVAEILSRVEGDVEVSGHTDDLPISTATIRSNWDLSTLRASSVVHHLVNRGGLGADRVAAQGYADSRPLVPNTSRENRAQNRRVEVSVQVPASIEKPFTPRIVQ